MKLTSRESEVLDQIATGLSAQEIADHLGIAYQTVRNHTTSIYRKLGVDSSVAALVKAGYICDDYRVATDAAMNYGDGYQAALRDVRASVRADILLDRPADEYILERLTRSVDQLSGATR